MSVQATLQTVSASLFCAAEQVKQLQSISGPSDIVAAVKELTGPLHSIVKEVANVKKEVESLKECNLLCLEELQKQTAIAKKQAQFSKAILRGNIQQENAKHVHQIPQGLKGFLRFPPSTKSEDDPPYTHAINGLEALSLENFRVLAKYYGVSADETSQGYNSKPNEQELKQRYRVALYADLNVK